MKWIMLACVLVFAPIAGAGNYCPPKPHSKPPSNNPSPPPVVVPPPVGHDCTYTGAGKDGQPGNDDCAPLPTPPTTTTTTPPRVTPPVTPPVVTTPTVITKTLTVTKTRTVVKWKTKRVVKVKRVFVACPKGYEPQANRKGCRPTGKHIAG